MTALETLTKKQIGKLEEAKSKLSIKLLKSLDYGEEIELNDTITLYHYCEDDIIVLTTTEEWEEVLQIMYDEENNSIIYDAL